LIYIHDYIKESAVKRWYCINPRPPRRIKRGDYSTFVNIRRTLWGCKNLFTESAIVFLSLKKP